jgi:hypothetical protein
LTTAWLTMKMKNGQLTFSHLRGILQSDAKTSTLPVCSMTDEIVNGLDWWRKSKTKNLSRQGYGFVMGSHEIYIYMIHEEFSSAITWNK